VISTAGERSGAVHRRCHAGHGREAGRQRHGPLADLAPVKKELDDEKIYMNHVENPLSHQI